MTRSLPPCLPRLLLCGSLVFPVGCGWQTGTVDQVGGGPSAPIPQRSGSVVFEGCSLDAGSAATLATAEAKQVVQTVILLCPSSDDQGAISPADAASREALASQVQSIRALGYQVHLALTMGVVASDGTIQPYDAPTTAAALANAGVRSLMATNVAPFAAMSDGIELELPPPPDASRDDVTGLVQALSGAIRPAKAFVLFVPPKGPTNDVPGAGAYDLPSLGSFVDRMRIETLDYSMGAPGPTIDTGWAVVVEQDVGGATRAPLDVAYPLYGWDFGPTGQTPVSWSTATTTASDRHASIQHGPTGAPFYDWTDDMGGAHETWFDDAASTSMGLRAWDAQTIPPDVGVVFWGLGSEDPSLWPTLARGMR
jgi:hypothetical protein